MKAGLMEIADVFAVNKSDRPEADKLVRELVTMVGMSPHDEHSWMMPVLKTEAVRDTGVKELIEAIERHQQHLTVSGQRQNKARDFLQNEVADILIERLQKSVKMAFDTASGHELVDSLLQRSIDPYKAADILSRI
jgi:LAO/AO transport system kinase